LQRETWLLKITDFISVKRVRVSLRAKTKEGVLKELVGLFDLDDKTRMILLKMVKKREKLGSTGVGKGVAIPHGRSLVVNRLMVAAGISKEGIDFDAADKKPAHLFFMLIAPAQEISNQYLPTLGKIAQFARSTKNVRRLIQTKEPKEFLNTLEQLEGK